LFDAVILDPPWYPTEYREWLSVVLPALKPNGTVFSVCFPELTRPTAFRELAQLLKLFSRLGKITVLSRLMRYVTPSFEHSVLVAARLPKLHHWRLAPVVAVNVQAAESIVKKEVRSETRPLRYWRRYQIGGRTIVHEDVRCDQRPVAHHPLPGRSNFLLDTVSSRAFDASTINMITSRNRAGTVQGMNRVTKMLTFLASGYSPAVAISRTSAGDAEESLALRQIIEDFELFA
jgi:hypothetical protein